AVQAKAHEDSLEPQFVFKKRDNGNASSTTSWNRLFAKRLFNGFFGCPVGHAVSRCNRRLTAVMGRNFYGYVLRRNAFEVFSEKCGDFVRILIRYQTHGNLGIRFGW